MRMPEPQKEWEPADTIERATDLKVIATIPVDEQGRAPIPPDEGFLEGVRFLRSALQTLPEGRSGNDVTLVQIGSVDCAPEFTGYLAKSFGEAGKKVALFATAGVGIPEGLGSENVRLALPSEKDLVADVRIKGPIIGGASWARGGEGTGVTVVMVDAKDASQQTVMHSVKRIGETPNVVGIALLTRAGSLDQQSLRTAGAPG